MATDILYIVGKRKSQWYDNELRYSLRSIAKYGRNIGRVWLAGYKPPFINEQEVGCLKVMDETTVKHYNIMHAIEEAVRCLPLSERFLYSSDDHFYIKPTDFDTYPVYWRGDMLQSEVEADDVNWQYHTTLASTRKLLECCGLPFARFSWHGNTWFDKGLFTEERFAMIRRFSYLMPEGVEPSCLMLNYWLHRYGLDLEERADLKLTGSETEAELLQKIKGRECVSAADNIEHTVLATYLQREFPQPCKYERI